MSVYILDPRTDLRWDRFVERDPRASVFHSRQWLEALHLTYGWRTLVLTTTAPGAELASGLPMCEVTGWLGRRLVSLPFSDHCEPLVSGPGERDEVAGFLRDRVRAGACRYVEVRPIGQGEPQLDAPPGGLSPSEDYCLHRLDLSVGAAAVFRRFHKSCVQRAIRRADREGLTCEVGRTPAAIRRFHRLLRMSRRRHGVPPQPVTWFDNLAASFGEQFQIRLALKDGRPVAGIVTLTSKESIVYKYGGSDLRFHHLGAMPWLFGRTVEEAVAAGFREFDLGRSDWNQPGLLAFKDHLGARRSPLSYYRYPRPAAPFAGRGWMVKAAKRVFARLPDPAFTLAGKVLYRHLG